MAAIFHADFYMCLQGYKLSLKSGHCREVHRILPIECICAFASGKEGDKLRCATYVGSTSRLLS